MSEKKEIPRVGPESDEIHPEYREDVEKLARSHGKEGGQTVHGLTGMEAHDESIKNLLTEDERRAEENRARFRKPKSSETKVAERIADEKDYEETYERGVRKRYERPYANVDRGSIAETFYRTLAEMHPELGIVIEDRASGKGGPILFQFTERDNIELIHELRYEHLVRILEMSKKDQAKMIGLGAELERRHELRAGTTERALARAYAREIQIQERLGVVSKKAAQVTQTKLDALHAEPLTDEEVRELLEEMIEKRMG